jgi:hypothetical protein
MPTSAMPGETAPHAMSETGVALLIAQRSQAGVLQRVPYSELPTPFVGSGRTDQNQLRC